MRFCKRQLERILFVAVVALLGAGCATVPPKELVLARQACQRAALGPANEGAPAEVHKAKASLDKAEASFADEPGSQRTRDLAYVAERKAQLASAISETRKFERARQRAEKDHTAGQKDMARQTTRALAETRRNLASTERDRFAGAKALGMERSARENAEKNPAEYEQRAKDAADALAKLAAVKEEKRGLAITLSGSILFATNQSTLLPAAQMRLDQVAEALMATKERSLIVEGDTDSQGSSGFNLGLSQRRTDAVRSYIVSRGYPGSRIHARGVGEDRPVAGNGNAEGRANNRRVEIVVEPKLTASAQP